MPGPASAPRRLQPLIGVTAPARAPECANEGRIGFHVTRD